MTNYVAPVDLLALDHHLKLNTTLEPLKSSLLKEQSSKFLLTTPYTCGVPMQTYCIHHFFMQSQGLWFY